MAKVIVTSVEQAIEYLDSRKSSGDMSADDAIIITARRQGRPEEDDWDLVEAAEVLAREVSDLRGQIEAAKHGL
jgi:tRNA threonylcarbamoyladenosine modification (KEOPS) complex  Pcc1 subunit